MTNSTLSTTRSHIGRPPKAPQGIVPIRLGEAVEKYMAHYRDGGQAESTLAGKKTITTVLRELLGENTWVWQLGKAEFNVVVNALYAGSSEEEIVKRKARGRAVRAGRTGKTARSFVRSTINQFIKYSKEYDWLPRTVDLGDLKVKAQGDGGTDRKPAREKKKYKPTEYAYVLNVAELIHPRCRMAVAMGLYFARRVSELTWLKWEHINEEEGYVRFWNQKGTRYIDIPIPEEFDEELARWRSYITKRYGFPEADWYVMPLKVATRYITGAGSRIHIRRNPALWPMTMTTKSSVDSLVKDNRKLLDKLGVDRVKMLAGTHTWRRSRATEVSDVHGLGVAQALLDHKDVRTTQEYTGNNEFTARLWKVYGRPGTRPPGGYSVLDKMPELVEEERLADNVIPIRKRSA